MGRKKIGEFTVEGKPHGKERHRFNTKRHCTYTPSTQVLAERDVREAYYAAGYKRLEFDGLVRLDVVACYAPPKGMPEEKKRALVGKPAYNSGVGKAGVDRREKIGDGDNIFKTVADALEGPKGGQPVAYKNDTQVIEGTFRSVYGERDCTKVRITLLADIERGE